MSDELTIDSEIYISSKRASELSGYAQDYIGQLARGNDIHARRVGGLWYVSLESLKKYKEESDLYKPEPPVHQSLNSPDSLLSFDGKTYISAAMAAKITGYNQDYVGQLARKSDILGRQVGNRWYIEREGILAHKKSKDALLGAVQAESVGIKRPEHGIQNEYGKKYDFQEDLLSYVREDGDAIPVLGVKGAARSIKEVDVQAVPIRILKSEVHIKHHPISEMSVITPALRKIQGVRVPRNTINPLVLPAAALTIVLVLSFSFVSLKGSSVYTETNPIKSLQRTQLALVAESFLDRSGDVLETLIVPELKYERQD